MQVAIKKVADVLSSPEQAKKVLREICILRRLRFPFLIALYDAFVRPSSSGARPAAFILPFPLQRLVTLPPQCECERGEEGGTREI